MLSAGMAVGALLVAGPTTVAGCASPPVPEQPDPLERPAQRAESDVAMAQAVANAHPALATAARSVATDRQAHAAALRAELRRVRPSPAPASSSAPPPPPPPAPIAAARRSAAQGELVGAMRAAQDEATGLVGALPGYRAALLASVAACCASHLTVLS
jgi:hypothetical protein